MDPLKIMTAKLEQHTNLGSVTPSFYEDVTVIKLEQHTNLGSVTPNGSSSPLTVLLEQHTNLGSVTPEEEYMDIMDNWNNIQIGGQ